MAGKRARWGVALLLLVGLLPETTRAGPYLGCGVDGVREDGRQGVSSPHGRLTNSAPGCWASFQTSLRASRRQPVCVPRYRGKDRRVRQVSAEEQREEARQNSEGEAGGEEGQARGQACADSADWPLSAPTVRPDVRLP